MLKTHNKSFFRVRSWSELEDDKNNYITLQAECMSNGEILAEQISLSDYDSSPNITCKQFRNGFQEIYINDKKVLEGYPNGAMVIKMLDSYVPEIRVQMEYEQ